MATFESKFGIGDEVYLVRMDYSECGDANFAWVCEKTVVGFVRFGEDGVEYNCHIAEDAFWPERDLFATKEAAQAECAWRNKEG